MARATRIQEAARWRIASPKGLVRWSLVRTTYTVTYKPYEGATCVLPSTTTEYLSRTMSSTKKVHFVVTGFGPFSGCRSNPTPEIIDELSEEVSRQPYEDDGGITRTNQLSFTLVKTHVFQTAAETVSAQLQELYEVFQNSVDTDGVYIMLHLGVNIGSCQFLLEQCAYNDATFRVPDELGYQPTNRKVVETDDFAIPRRTRLQLDRILSEPLSKICQISIDPGRYVCNYTYFKSLAYCEHVNTTTAKGCDEIDTKRDSPPNKNNIYALFLHVPPLEAIPLKDQVKFILDLMERISLSVSLRSS